MALSNRLRNPVAVSLVQTALHPDDRAADYSTNLSCNRDSRNCTQAEHTNTGYTSKDPKRVPSPNPNMAIRNQSPRIPSPSQNLNLPNPSRPSRHATRSLPNRRTRPVRQSQSRDQTQIRRATRRDRTHFSTHQRNAMRRRKLQRCEP
jgi:hypothetical protein